MDKMISVGNLAEVLGVSEGDIALWAIQNKISAYYETDRLGDFKRAEIEKWIETRNATETTNSDLPKEEVLTKRILRLLMERTDREFWTIMAIASELKENVKPVRKATILLAAQGQCTIDKMTVGAETKDVISVRQGGR